MHLNAVTVVLDLMKPLVALGRLGLQGGKLGFMNPGISIRFDTRETQMKSPPYLAANGEHSTYFPRISNNQGA
jgi:hypothetical protein